MVVYDTKRFRRIQGFLLMPLSIAFLLIGVFLIHFAPESENPTLALVLGTLFALGGTYATVYTAITLNRIPPVYAYYLGRTNWHYFWFNGAGIWRDKKFLTPWEEVFDVELVKVWRERKFVGTGQVIVIVHGTVRVILNSGHVLEIKDVLNPEEVLRLMRESYLRR